ncbi:outer membrane transport energization protein TonB [Mariprofundus ferrinatatus]|uniref:Protein TonB n=1 Tax=Mariprofundus ferrinatatus TaxID=1921087 RepID=A0A2K8LDJ6_9PROT|nr:TonB family protein [Mariprofundus ferrinatatus]ATX82356.1 outer membrane transport energization protein TonB [Mariprofundus ferrinatatus]
MSGEGRGIRQIGLRSAAVTLSLLLHGLLFIGFGGVTSAPAPDPINPSVTRLSFLTHAPEPAPVPERIQEKPERVEAKKIEKVKRPEAKKVAKVKPQEAKQEAQPETAVLQQAVAEASQAAPQINEGVIQLEKERYLADVMARIEEHKWYPKAARRRGIEGEVNVRFVLFPDGSARQLMVDNGPLLLLSAAKEAVERAVPLPKPPSNVHCPLECEFRMRFRLDAT